MKKIYIVCALFFLVAGCVKTPIFNDKAITQEDDVTRAATNERRYGTIYDFPVRPGTPEWEIFETTEEMLKACQLPESILATASTRDLAAICLDYPLYFIYIAYNDKRMGMNIMIEQFNGFEELSRRKDGTLELMEIYRTFPVLTSAQPKSSPDYHTPYKLPFLELLMASDVFSNQLDNQSAAELGKIVLEKYENKLTNIHIYGLYGIQTTLLLGAVSIDKNSASEKSPVVKQFIENFSYAEPSLITEISQIISSL